MEAHDSSFSKIVILIQAEIAKKHFIGNIQRVVVKTVVLKSLCFEEFYGVIVQIINRNIRHRHAVPSAAMHGKNHLVKFIACHFLRRRSGTFVILTMVTDRNRILFNNDLKIPFFIITQQIHSANQSHGMKYFIGDVLHEFFFILHSANFTIIANANVKCSTISVCKCTNPFQAIVSPRLFKLHMLAFILLYFHHSFFYS